MLTIRAKLQEARYRASEKKFFSKKQPGWETKKEHGLKPNEKKKSHLTIKTIDIK